MGAQAGPADQAQEDRRQRSSPRIPVAAKGGVRPLVAPHRCSGVAEPPQRLAEPEQRFGGLVVAQRGFEGLPGRDPAARLEALLTGTEGAGGDIARRGTIVRTRVLALVVRSGTGIVGRFRPDDEGAPMTTTHSEALGHEHLPDDGCETVEHEDHVDHFHSDERHREDKIHRDHPGGPHSADDGFERRCSTATMRTMSTTVTGTTSTLTTSTSTERALTAVGRPARARQGPTGSR